MTARRHHDAVLGVPNTATARQIKEAYRRLAREHHPDTNAGDAAREKKFKRIARAYETLGDPKKRQAYDTRHTTGRFAGPGVGGPQAIKVEGMDPVYHLDLGHHSDVHQAGDPLSVTEAAAVGRNPAWLRKAIRERRLRASKGPEGYLLRWRDVERLDRQTARRKPKPGREPVLDADVLAAAES
jgi:curved DNA-binding protein CbpA